MVNMTKQNIRDLNAIVKAEGIQGLSINYVSNKAFMTKRAISNIIQFDILIVEFSPSAFSLTWKMAK
jgi:hypothetical protein